MVMIRPGTSPKTEYEYGNDMIAKHMYSEKSRAAVYHEVLASGLVGVCNSPAHAQELLDYALTR